MRLAMLRFAAPKFLFVCTGCAFVVHEGSDESLLNPGGGMPNQNLKKKSYFPTVLCRVNVKNSMQHGPDRPPLIRSSTLHSRSVKRLSERPAANLDDVKAGADAAEPARQEGSSGGAISWPTVPTRAR